MAWLNVLISQFTCWQWLWSTGPVCQMRLVHTDLHREPQHEERQAGGVKVVEERKREVRGKERKEREGGQLLQRELSCGGTIGLTSEHLQSSRWAWRKSRAAFLYFLFSSSASPAEHLSLQAISWLAATEVDWPLCTVAGRGVAPWRIFNLQMACTLPFLGWPLLCCSSSALAASS